jgi:acetyl esterase/lipase
MRAIPVTALTMLCLCFRSAAADERAADTTGDAAFLAMVNRPVALEVQGAERVQVRENLPYRSVAGGALRADVYLAARGGGPAPVVILVHGGVGPEFPVRPKDWGFYTSWGRLLAASGLTAVTFNHRLGYPEPAIDEALSDVDSLAAFVRRQAAGWGADPGRIAIVTYSAGGMLLAPWIRETRPGVRCIVAFYPIIDLRVAKHLQQHLRPEQLEAYSAGSHLAKSARTMPPLLLIRAGRDQIPDLLAGVDRFVAEALAANAPLTLANLPDAPHGFDNGRADPRTLEVLRQTLAFLTTHLSGGTAKR